MFLTELKFRSVYDLKLVLTFKLFFDHVWASMLEYNKLLFCIFIIIHTQIFYRINEFLSRDGALNLFFYYFSQNICDPSRYPKQNMNYF